MPGSIHISATQPPATPLFLQVAVGKREYNGNIEHDDLSFPVTSLRESMVIMLYNADRELISKTELQTKTIVESVTTDVVFTLDSGGEVTLQLQFLLSDDDRKRIQEMRSSAMKRKQQELHGNGYELNFPDSLLSKRLIEKISNIESKRDETKLQKSLPLDDLQDRDISSGKNVDPLMKASRDLLLQSGGRKFEDPDGSKEGHGKPAESRSSSAVKKMISAFESTSSQGILSSSETDASLTFSSGRKETEKAIVPSGDKGWNERSRKQVSFVVKPVQNESRRRRASGARKQKMREHDELSGSKRRSQAKSTVPFSVEQLHSMFGSSRSYVEYPLNCLVATSSTWLHPHVCVTSASRELKDVLELEQLSSTTHIKSEMAERRCDEKLVASAGGGFPVLNLNGWWLVHQGVRAAIVVIACGAVFLNNKS